MVSDLNFESVSDLISEVLFSFSTRIFWLYIDRCCTLVGNMYLTTVLESSRINCLREFFDTMPRFSTWINLDQLDL